MRRVRAGGLDVAYPESGPARGRPVVLLHGFAYDVRSCAVVRRRPIPPGVGHTVLQEAPDAVADGILGPSTL